MKDTVPLPPPILDEHGIWRDPMPLASMTPRQRGRYVRLLREDAGFAPHGHEMRRAREQLERLLERMCGSERGQPENDTDGAG
jgi:hypothetical protein